MLVSGRKAILRTLVVAAGLALLITGSASPTAGPTRLAVYLVRGERVSPVRRVVPHTQAVVHASLLALLRGPTRTERNAGYATCIPAGAVLHGVSLSGRTATVDLGGRFEAGGGSQSMLLRVAQVVHTVTQFAGVDRVGFRVDGRPVEAIGGEGVIVAPPVGRAAFEAQAPPILVEQPLPGDRVGSPIVVRGTANVFEARLEVEARAPGGALLGHRAVLATAGTGTRGRFATRLAVPPAYSRLTVVVYSRSPKNGARIDIVHVTVRR